ncbi:thermonuclease family protein [Parahaliea mediterranea]|uniref:thermonuclease family protein n=1 Tax=Parahaliea mediterranea TaxID=651086 RepID=UPI0013006705|nr:thermonuclease family protein [Parahaliea mediterranea]
MKPVGSQLHRVIDGDTVEATIPGYGRERIRLSSIDAPERNQPYGNQSTQCLRELLRQGSLSVKPKKTDKYGRLVADLYVGDDRVDVAMVERGCAWWYSRYAPASVVLAKAHYTAKFEKRGLWAGSNPIKPEQWRRR